MRGTCRFPSYPVSLAFILFANHSMCSALLLYHFRIFPDEGKHDGEDEKGMQENGSNHSLQHSSVCCGRFTRSPF